MKLTSSVSVDIEWCSNELWITEDIDDYAHYFLARLTKGQVVDLLKQLIDAKCPKIDVNISSEEVDER